MGNPDATRISTGQVIGRTWRACRVRPLDPSWLLQCKLREFNQLAALGGTFMSA
jgi:hypothetical protein